MVLRNKTIPFFDYTYLPDCEFTSLIDLSELSLQVYSAAGVPPYTEQTFLVLAKLIHISDDEQSLRCVSFSAFN